MTDGFDDEQRTAAEPAADDLWAFDPDDRDPDGEAPERSMLPLILLVVGVLAVVAVLVAVVAGGGDDDDAANGPDATEPGADAAPSSTATCLRWPPTVDAFGEPEFASAPGLHVWFDFTGWHIRRVDGDAVPSAVVTITSTTPEQPPIAGAASGGAVVTTTEDAAVEIRLPDVDGSSEGSFDVPFYAQGVVITVADEVGQPLPNDQITGGASDGPIAANPLTAVRADVPC